MTSIDVALLTDRRYTADAAADGDWYLGNVLADDRLLRDALARRGLSSARVDLAAAGIDWSDFRCAVFRTTWDYFDRFAEFSTWLEWAGRQKQMCNPVATVRWNMDTHDLADLAARGVPVVPTLILERGSARTLTDVLAEPVGTRSSSSRACPGRPGTPTGSTVVPRPITRRCSARCWPSSR